MGSMLSRNEFPVDGRTVLITGGSRGLGRSAARQLAEKGASIVIVARDAAVLAEAIEYISEGARSPSTQRFHAIAADVTTSAECVRVVAEATAWNHDHPPDMVWCASGSAHPSLFVDTPVAQLQAMMDSNYFSSAYMAHAVLNAWLHPALADAESNAKNASNPAGGDGGKPAGAAESEAVRNPPPARHLVLTGSFVSFFSFAGFTPYSPSKAAVRSLADSLSQEMNLYAGAFPLAPRVRVHAVFPATMPTQGLVDENRVKTDLTKSLEEGDQVLTPEECARRAIAGLECGEELVATSGIIRLVMTSVMGGSIRGGWLKGCVDTVLGWVVLIVMVFVRWEMDAKVMKWGREHGPSGMKRRE